MPKRKNSLDDAGAVPAPGPLCAPESVPGMSMSDCTGIVAKHTAELYSRSDDTLEEARARAAAAARAVRKAACLAAEADPGAWRDPVLTLGSLIYTQPNDTTCAAVGSVANIVDSPLAPRVSLEGVDDVFVHASLRALPVTGAYGRAWPVAGGLMLTEQPPPSERPRVVLTFPFSDPHLPLRCARIELAKTDAGLICATVFAESDRREPPPIGVALGPAEGARLRSSERTAALFAPSQSLRALRRAECAAQWIGNYDADVGLRRRSEQLPEGDERSTVYEAPAFLTRALAHLATRNLRLHVVVNAAAAGLGAKPVSEMAWRRCAFEPATLHPLPAADNHNHTFYLRARFHKTQCGCLCRAYAPLVAGGHTAAGATCEPCLDVYVCGRAIVEGRCPKHDTDTRTVSCESARAAGICVACTSVRLRCVHATDSAPLSVDRCYPTYNSLDHEVLLSLAEKRIVREIASSAVYLRRTALANYAQYGALVTQQSIAYLNDERTRLSDALTALYTENAEEERVETASSSVRGVEWLVRAALPPENTLNLQTLDNRAAQLLCDGDVTFQIGDLTEQGALSTKYSCPKNGKLRIQPQIRRLMGVAKLWRRPVRDDGRDEPPPSADGQEDQGPNRPTDTSRVPVSRVKHGMELEYSYGRLFGHRRANGDGHDGSRA